MINLPKYTDKDLSELNYFITVKKYVPLDLRKEIVESSKKYLPSTFYTSGKSIEEEFEELVMSPYDKIDKAIIYMKKSKKMRNECFIKDKPTEIYKKFQDLFSSIMKSQSKKTSMRVRIVEKLKITVCPYCNRDYINYRSETSSGAQIDHFFNKGNFPIFSISLYNLIPVCGNCNRVKSSKVLEFASPFDTNIDWNDGIVFSYSQKSIDDEEDVQVKIKASGKIKNNLYGMDIHTAYSIHSSEVKDLLNKEKIYTASQLEEFIEVMGEDKINKKQIKQIVFGPEITIESFKTKPLSKMMYDLYKQLKIYTE